MELWNEKSYCCDAANDNVPNKIAKKNI